MNSPAGRYDFVKKYSLFLLFTGIAALLGGIFSHGFKYYFGLSYSFPGWLIALGGAYYASIAAFRHALANELWPDIKPTTIKITEQILMLLLVIFMVNAEYREQDLYMGHRNWSSCIICVYL